MLTRQAILRTLRRLHRDEGGQSVLFAAISFMVLIAFLAMTFNVGVAVSRRVRAQLGVDAMAYSGAVIEANALSAIGWINSGMAQVYRRIMRLSVDASATAVAAELASRQGNGGGIPYDTFRQALSRAESGNTGIPRLKELLADLSKIQNALAIITPEIMWEEMYRIGKTHGLERMAIFPFQRMFPHEGREASYRIEQLEDGWRITNLNAQDGEEVTVRLDAANKWHIVHTRGDLVQREWVISQVSADEWRVERLGPSGVVEEQHRLVRTGDEWSIISNDSVQLQATTMGKKRCMAITYQGVTEYVRRSGGSLYKWDAREKEWGNLTEDSVQVGDYTVQVHSSNTIRVGGMTVWVTDPPRVSVGGAHITCSTPPWIRVSAAGLTIGIHGFSTDDYSISFMGHSLTRQNADGRWRMHFSNQLKLWWRHRLVEQEPEKADALKQWQYDYQLLGAILRYENNLGRFALRHAIEDEPAYRTSHPLWTSWFDPERGRITDSRAYYLTQTCSRCNGVGEIETGDPRNPRRRCPQCRGLDHDGVGGTDVRVYVGEVIGNGSGIRVPSSIANPVPFTDSGETRWPLTLTEDFFRWGITVGAWRPPEEEPMLFNKEPSWGYVTIACARVGVPYVASGEAGETTHIRYRFPDRVSREEWIENATENFYRGRLRAKLVSSRTQVSQFDLDEYLWAGETTNTTTESATSFLWHTLINGRFGGLDEASLWFDEPSGQSDFEMSDRLQNMKNREGDNFNLRSELMDDVVRH